MEIQCNKCNEIKNISEFYKVKKSKTGYRNYCKDCEKKLVNEHYYNNRERLNKLNCERNREKYGKDKLKCRTCKIIKPNTAFSISEKSANGYLRRCKECTDYYNTNKQRLQKDYILKTNYGIDINHFEKMLEFQNYSCEICKMHQDDMTGPLCVDHCHTTGEVRGLLCFRCNASIGKFEDDINLLTNAINYLQKYSK